MERVYRTDLKLLRYFLAVAEELHFGRAAARLNMSQPPLSIHIKELENQLGTQLFIRHSRSVVLTHAGKILMEESRRLLVNANNVLARIEQIGRGEAGRIELGVVGTAMWGRMRPVMRRFLRENPNVDVLFREVNEPQTVLAMVSMGIGITLIADSYAQMNWPGVIFRPLKQRIPADLYIVYETQQVTPVMVKLLAALTQ